MASAHGKSLRDGADARSTMFSHGLRSKCADLDEILPKNMYNCKKSVDNK